MRLCILFVVIPFVLTGCAAQSQSVERAAKLAADTVPAGKTTSDNSAEEFNANEAAGKAPNMGLSVIVDDPVIYTPGPDSGEPGATDNYEAKIRFPSDYDVALPALKGQSVEAIWWVPYDEVYNLDHFWHIRVTTSPKGDGFYRLHVEGYKENARLRIYVICLVKRAAAKHG